MTASAISQAAMLPSGYTEWIADVKRRIRAAQQRAALAVNQEMLQLYWQIGRDILDRRPDGERGFSARSKPTCASRSPRCEASRGQISRICERLPRLGPTRP